MTRVSLRVLTVSLTALLLGATAHADIMGRIWENDPTGAGNAIPGNVPTTTPNVTFSLTGSTIDFESHGSTDYTIGSFLATGGATITSGAGEAGNTLNNTIFDITGTVSVTNGETFTVGHDDGLTLIIGGVTVIGAPGGPSFTPTTGTYTGRLGTSPSNWSMEKPSEHPRI